MKFIVALVFSSVSWITPEVVIGQSLKPMLSNEIVERLAPPAVRSRSIRERGFSLEPRKIDFEINFDFDSARIKTDSLPQLEEIARAMAEERLSQVRFRVEGHTDGVGTTAYNDDLSSRRARAVVDFLKTKGIRADRLEAEGRGMRELVDRENPKAASNRRVRVVAMD